MVSHHGQLFGTDGRQTWVEPELFRAMDAELAHDDIRARAAWDQFDARLVEEYELEMALCQWGDEGPCA